MAGTGSGSSFSSSSSSSSSCSACHLLRFFLEPLLMLWGGMHFVFNHSAMQGVHRTHHHSTPCWHGLWITSCIFHISIHTLTLATAPRSFFFSHKFLTAWLTLLYLREALAWEVQTAFKTASRQNQALPASVHVLTWGLCHALTSWCWWAGWTHAEVTSRLPEMRSWRGFFHAQPWDQCGTKPWSWAWHPCPSVTFEDRQN